jgi:alkane 1-monooxygenase
MHRVTLIPVIGPALARLWPRDAGARAMAAFAAATIVPGLAIALGAVAGGVWVWLALAAMTVVVGVLDRLAGRAAPALPGADGFPAADRLSAGLALFHLALVPLVVWALAGGSGLGLAERVGLFVAAGLYLGQVANANAHELIHRTDRRLFRLGAAVYTALLFAHHTSAHRHVHHRFVATEDDPNSARRGESLYAFVPRAWIGSFVAGHEIETALRQRRAPGARRGLHPYVWYLAGMAACVAAIGLAFGAAGVAAYVALAAHAQVQLLVSDYVQHYGLARARRPDGGIAPVAAGHSWNAPHRASSALMLNAPRHSDHHAHPARPYPALTLPEGAPTLPHSLPVMGMLAFYPRRFFRVMDRRLDRLTQG